MTIDELADATTAALKVTFVAREGLHKGEYYDADLPGGGTVEVRPNSVQDYDGEDVIEGRFADHPVLLYIHRSEHGAELERALTSISGLELLRRDTRE